MMFCDKDGVPRTVQRIRFNYMMFGYDVTLFTGLEVFVPCDHATPNLGLMESPREAEYKDVFAFVDANIRFYLPRPKLRAVS